MSSPSFLVLAIWIIWSAFSAAPFKRTVTWYRRSRWRSERKRRCRLANLNRYRWEKTVYTHTHRHTHGNLYLPIPCWSGLPFCIKPQLSFFNGKKKEKRHEIIRARGGGDGISQTLRLMRHSDTVVSRNFISLVGFYSCIFSFFVMGG